MSFGNGKTEFTKREVTEFDLRAEEFKHPETKLEDLEFRDDGKIVRKDRFERGFKSLVEPAGFSLRHFEIDDVVDRVEETFAALENIDFGFVLMVLKQSRNAIAGIQNTHPAYVQDVDNCIAVVEKAMKRIIVEE
jgi:hypothetical protein